MPKALNRKITCQVCNHPERHRIEAHRLAGTSALLLCERYGLKKDSIYRHMIGHVSPDMKAEIMADVPLSELVDKAATEGQSLIDYFSMIRSSVMTGMHKAAAVGDRKGHSALAKRAIEVNAEIGRLTGELLNAAPIRNHIQNTLIVGTPMMTQLQTMLLDRLGPFPEALRAVMDGLQELDTQQTPLIEHSAQEGSYAA